MTYSQKIRKATKIKSDINKVLHPSKKDKYYDNKQIIINDFITIDLRCGECSLITREWSKEVMLTFKISHAEGAFYNRSESYTYITIDTDKIESYYFR